MVKKQRATLFGVSGEKVEDEHPNIIYEGMPQLDEFWFAVSKGPPVFALKLTNLENVVNFNSAADLNEA